MIPKLMSFVFLLSFLLKENISPCCDKQPHAEKQEQHSFDMSSIVPVCVGSSKPFHEPVKFSVVLFTCLHAPIKWVNDKGITVKNTL